MNEEEIAKVVVDSSIKVHRALGPGLLESAYENVLVHELIKAGLSCEVQVLIPINYDSKTFDNGFRADIVIENKVILELKAVEKVLPVHHKQLLTYLKLSQLKLGFLLNFNMKLMKDGITRCVNNL